MCSCGWFLVLNMLYCVLHVVGTKPLISMHFDSPVLLHGPHLLHTHGNAQLTSAGLFVGAPDGGLTIDVPSQADFRQWTIVLALRFDQCRSYEVLSILNVSELICDRRVLTWSLPCTLQTLSSMHP